MGIRQDGPGKACEKILLQEFEEKKEKGKKPRAAGIPEQQGGEEEEGEVEVEEEPRQN